MEIAPMVLDGFIDISSALRCGVYALISRGRVIYVGKSKCMLVRVYSHRNVKARGSHPSWFPVKGIAFDEVHVQPCSPDTLDALERKMIDRFKPPLNTHHMSSAIIRHPFSVQIGDVRLTVPCGVHPYLPKIERRV